MFPPRPTTPTTPTSINHPILVKLDHFLLWSTTSSHAEKPEYQDRFKFKNVQLLKDQSLGIGSYGGVCKAKCDDLLCAAKILHPTLFDPTSKRAQTTNQEVWEYCSSKATKNNLISGFRQVAFLQPHQKSQVSYNYNEHIAVSYTHLTLPTILRV